VFVDARGIAKLGITGGELHLGRGGSVAESTEPYEEKKLQAPSSKHQRNSKHQAPNEAARSPFGAWHLELLWSLELGAWSFERAFGIAR
jgi:hypothetical protein